MKSALLKLWNRIKNGREGSNPTPTQSMLRIIAGGYLVYLAIKITIDLPNQNFEAWKMALMIAFVIAFVIVGIIFAMIGVFAIIRSTSKQDDDNELEDAVEIEATEKMETDKCEENVESKE